MISLIGPLYVATGILIGVLSTIFVTHLIRQAHEIKSLRNEVEQLKQGEQPKRHTHNTVAAIEDALAVAIDAVMEVDASQEYARARIRQLQGILGTAREGPYAYDIERQAGSRPKKNGGKHA